ncbi:MAG: CBS domain-containing protein [Actinobacteria bacterium]|nr:CBS domain-containing protein [Actinomycetota bacterium]
MKVADAMTPVVLMVGPEHTLRQASEMMMERKVGSAVILDPDGAGPGIITERDILRSLAAGQDPDEEVVDDHLTDSATVCGPDTALEDAASIMMRGGFRHVIVANATGVVGVLSMRDIVRSWLTEHSPAI